MKLAEITGNSRKGWAGTATLGQFAAPLVAGYLLGLNQRQLAEAVSISGAHNLSLAVAYFYPVGMMKDTLNAFAAQSGVQAALLAKRGFTGPAGVFEALGGLWPQLESPATPEMLATDLGRPFRIVKWGMNNPAASRGVSKPKTTAKVSAKGRGIEPGEIQQRRSTIDRMLAYSV